ncbi:MAG TPA: CPBP family intramembrane metalloprotease [Crocinitomicaceae bacterium]|nr:CPBP family intramembrane metalloprotease [Crocinitomicaceae bacterium]
MISKQKIYLLGLVTLLVFPIPTFVYRIFWLHESVADILELNSLVSRRTLNGLAFGIMYALLSVYLLKKPIFKNELSKQQTILSHLNLNAFDAIFLSLCAGIGEELLFRAGLQLVLNPILVTIIFIAIHGYYNPRNWRLSLYGLLLTPFILVISYGFEYYGLWFAIAAHFAYDWVLFNDSRLKTTTE